MSVDSVISNYSDKETITSELGELNDQVFRVEQSLGLEGAVSVSGAKNAVLVIMASLMLTDGVSLLKNVPHSADVLNMIELLRGLGATVTFNLEQHSLEIDTSGICGWRVQQEIMKKMRASVLVMGPLLQRFGQAEIALPGGCVIGTRPIDFHLKAFGCFDVDLSQEQHYLYAKAHKLRPARVILEYPSVGATENIVMLASLIKGTSTIINASLEPEVFDLLHVLQKMGADISIKPPATIEIHGVSSLKPIEHSIIPDRLEAGGLLLVAAITQGSVLLKDARAEHLDVFLEKLSDMGHTITCDERGIFLKASSAPKAVSFRTSPYPGFPTDLQAPMMVAQCLADGKSIIHETVFENRFLHIRELEKLGAHIEIKGDRAIIIGVDHLYGGTVIATDIRASCALVLAGLAARGTTLIKGLHHWRRGYEALEKKLRILGANIELV